MEKSIIVVPDKNNPGGGIILTGSPLGNRILRGASGEVMFDTTVTVEQVQTPESEVK